MIYLFHISGFIRRKKALEMGNVPLFKLLMEMKLFLTCQTIRVFASGLHLFHFYKDVRRPSTCVTIIVTDSFDDFATRSFDFSYLCLKRERVNILTRPT